jgi:hemerythrin superfamily protein
MDAIELLKQQHRQVEKLFDDFKASEGDDDRQEAFNAVGDALMVHTAIEERYLYPAAFGSSTASQLRESVEEHLATKRELADVLATAIDDEYFDAKVAVLEQLVKHHVGVEEESLFPIIRESLGRPRLERLAKQMQRLASEIEDEGSPRDNVFSEITTAAPLHPPEHIR